MDRSTTATGPFSAVHSGIARRGIPDRCTLRCAFSAWQELCRAVVACAFSRRRSAAFVMPSAVFGKEHTTPSKRSAHPANLATNQAKGMALPTIVC